MFFSWPLAFWSIFLLASIALVASALAIFLGGFVAALSPVGARSFLFCETWALLVIASAELSLPVSPPILFAFLVSVDVAVAVAGAVAVTVAVTGAVAVAVAGASL